MYLLNYKCDFFLCFYASGCECGNEHWVFHKVGSTCRLALFSRTALAAVSGTCRATQTASSNDCDRIVVRGDYIGTCRATFSGAEGSDAAITEIPGKRDTCHGK
jgi:hypothetical protein